MPPKVKSKNWSKKEKQFIKVVKQHIELFHGYRYNMKYSKVIKQTWQEVSVKLNRSAAYCKTKWNGIKYTYAKLKRMIRIGRVTEEMVRVHEETSKYLDGSLDFLDPFIYETPDFKLPTHVHTFFDSVFGANTNTDLSVDAEKLIKVEGNNYIEVIEDYRKRSSIEPTSILPNDENYDSDSTTTSAKQAFVDFAMEEPKKEDTSIDKIVVNDADPVEHIILPAITLPEDETNYTSVNDKVNTNGDEKSSLVNHHDMIARLLVNYNKAYQTNEQTSNLNKYMQDLAEVLCCRLVPEKRKQFLSQIDLIVSELLEGN